MSIRAKAKYFRNLDGKNVKINKVFNPYLSGGIETAGKFVGKTFKYFPRRLMDDVIANGDERAKLTPEDTKDKMELREQIWNKDTKQFEFHKVKEKLTKEFFQTYKKVFDVELIVDGGAKVSAWDSTLKSEVEIDSGFDSIMFQGVGASKVKSMIEGLDLDAGLQMVNGKDKAGNPALVKPFDWEDSLKNNLENKFVKVRVRGTGMDTKYTFTEGVEFSITEVKPDDKPFTEEIPFDEVPF